ncbi:nuclear transport factor 2 family protein [Rothia dentocariosa]|uniref:nuclear transport factor 2 family protein n=2 Tax=Rothia dentocariosa TaxID=2047 RepID=UPI0039A2C55C
MELSDARLSLYVFPPQMMEGIMIDETMKTLTEELISRGTSYDIDFLKRVYADNLKFVRILPDNTVQILSKQDNIDFFQSLKDNGAAPLNTAHTILFADSDGETGTIVLKRRMSQGSQEQDFLFTITWKKRDKHWQIVQEIVAVLSE